MSSVEIHLPDYSSTAEIVRAVLPALGARQVYQRAAELVHVVRDPRVVNGVTLPVGKPRIRELPKALLANELAECASWTEDAGPQGLRSVKPSSEVIMSVLEAGEWSHVRELRGIAHWPVATQGGIALRDGYDASSRYLLCDLPQLEPLQDEATQTDAQAALSELLALISDFPISTEAERSVWLALILTLIARPGISGPTPAFVFDAPTPGAGKTLLASTAATLVTGEEPAARGMPTDGAEWNRALASIARSGAPFVLFDNVRGKVESGMFEAALTSGKITERKLRSIDEVTAELCAVFAITANNASITVDLARRSLQCRLAPTTERPELVQGFKIPDLSGYVQQHRAHLLRCALLILHAYRCAGSPPVTMRPMGSFERWSYAVRAPLIWAGGADPAETQDALREGSADELGEQCALLAAWHDAFGEKPTTLSEALAVAKTEAGAPLLSALCEVSGQDAEKLGSRHVGAQLKKLKDRIVRGYRLSGVKGKASEGALWAVTLVNHQDIKGTAEPIALAA